MKAGVLGGLHHRKGWGAEMTEPLQHWGLARVLKWAKADSPEGPRGATGQSRVSTGSLGHIQRPAPPFTERAKGHSEAAGPSPPTHWADPALTRRGEEAGAARPFPHAA